jgi:hypothetical protein
MDRLGQKETKRQQTNYTEPRVELPWHGPQGYHAKYPGTDISSLNHPQRFLGDVGVSYLECSAVIVFERIWGVGQLISRRWLFDGFAGAQGTRSDLISTAA